MSKMNRRAVALIGAASLVAAGFAVALQSGPAVAAPSSPTLNARTLLSGKSHGWTQPDDLADVNGSLFVGFQNGVPSTGGTASTPKDSTLVQFTAKGAIVRHLSLVGKIDGMGADPANKRVIVTVNEDGNSSLYTVSTSGAVKHYRFNLSPLPHGGGTDSVDVVGGRIYLSASNPSSKSGPAVFQVTLAGTTAHIAAEPFRDNSVARVANAGHSALVHLALTDPDSSTTVPSSASRFGGTFMLDAQGDQQAVFVSHISESTRWLRVLNLSQSVDDTAFASMAGGMFITTDSTADAVVALTGTIAQGAEYTSVTPGNANNAPANPGPNYFGTINLLTGTVSAVHTGGVAFNPKGLIYVP
jgi:hypothetical protein